MVSSATAEAPPPDADTGTAPETDFEPNGVDHGSLSHFEEFCKRFIRVGDPARQLILDPFQRTMLRDYFAGVPETLILLPKGNGKSTLLAALAVYHLATVPRADIKIVAASRPGAEQIFEFAHAMIAGHPSLEKRFKVTPSTREIRTRKGLGHLKALPAEKKGIDGKAPTLVLCDELHHWDQPEIYAFLAGGLNKRGGRLVGITTAGADRSSFLGQIRARALAFLSKHIGPYKYALTPDESFALHEWSLDDGQDHENFELVKAANPLTTISRASLERTFRSPSTFVTTWCRLHCNQWVQDAEAYINQIEFAQRLNPGCLIADGTPVIIGSDFGWSRDTTALIPIGVISKSPLIVRIDARLKIIKPPPGGSTNIETIKAAYREFHAIWPHMKVALDPNAGGNIIADWLSDELDVEVIVQPQDPSPMAHAAGLVAELVRAGHFEHPGDPEYTRQVTNAPAAPVGTGGDKYRFGKHRDVPNDCPVATAIGVRQAALEEEPEEADMPFFL